MTKGNGKAGKSPQGNGVKFTTVSGEPIEQLYTPEDIAHINALRDIGHPGEFPYTRGIHPDMYRGKLWTMRQFAGFGTPEDTNERYHYLLEHGQTGLSVAFDLPTLMGRDADDPMSEGEDAATVAAVGEAGFHAAVTVEAGLVTSGTNRLLLPRYEIGPRQRADFPSRLRDIFDTCLLTR